jgi:hypothetical protein
MSRASIDIRDLPEATQREVRKRSSLAARAGADTPSVNGVKLGKNSPLRQVAKPRQRASDLEHPIQVELFAWIDDPATIKHYPDIASAYAIPNWFGARTAKQGARAKAEGRRSGMPDLCVPSPRRTSDGSVCGALYVEMKDESGTVRQSQRERIALLRRAGNRCEVAMSVDAAKAIIVHYLNLPKP